MPKDEPIFMRLNKERGKSRTIIGAISSLHWVEMKFNIVDKTNTFFFCEFLEYICHKSLCPDPRNTVIDPEWLKDKYPDLMKPKRKKVIRKTRKKHLTMD